jgi:hypothetical protein
MATEHLTTLLRWRTVKEYSPFVQYGQETDQVSETEQAVAANVIPA